MIWLLTWKVDLGRRRDGAANLLADRREFASRLEALETGRRRVRCGKGSRGKESGGRKGLTHGGQQYDDLGLEKERAGQAGAVCRRRTASVSEGLKRKEHSKNIALTTLDLYISWPAPAGSSSKRSGVPRSRSVTANNLRVRAPAKGHLRAAITFWRRCDRQYQ